MADAIVVLNAGSSSLKFSVFVARGTGLELDVRGNIEEIETAPRFVAKDREGQVRAEKSWGEDAGLGREGALDYLLEFLRGELAGDHLVAVGHRVVHGGAAYAQPVRLDRGVLAALEHLVPLAPLHQPHNLAPIRVLLERAPDLPQVACFDTAFHATNPELAQRFALPAEFHDAGVRRYGFHGLSYEYIASALPALDAKAAAGRTVVAAPGQRGQHVRPRGRP